MPTIELLPLFRWGEASGSLDGSLLGVKNFAHRIFIFFSHFVWEILKTFANQTTRFASKETLDKILLGASPLRDNIRSYFGIIIGLAITILLFRLIKNYGKDGLKEIIKFLILATLAIMSLFPAFIGPLNATVFRVVFAPSTALGTIGDFISEVDTEIEDVSSVISGDLLDCRAYAEELKETYLQHNNSLSDLPIYLSALWEQTHLRNWVNVQYGSLNTTAYKTYCRRLDSAAGIPSARQAGIQVCATEDQLKEKPLPINVTRAAEILNPGSTTKEKAIDAATNKISATSSQEKDDEDDGRDRLSRLNRNEFLEHQIAVCPNGAKALGISNTIPYGAFRTSSSAFLLGGFADDQAWAICAVKEKIEEEEDEFVGPVLRPEYVNYWDRDKPEVQSGTISGSSSRFVVHPGFVDLRVDDIFPDDPYPQTIGEIYEDNAVCQQWWSGQSTISDTCALWLQFTDVCQLPESRLGRAIEGVNPNEQVFSIQTGDIISRSINTEADVEAFEYIQIRNTSGKSGGGGELFFNYLSIFNVLMLGILLAVAIFTVLIGVLAYGLLVIISPALVLANMFERGKKFASGVLVWVFPKLIVGSMASIIIGAFYLANSFLVLIVPSGRVRVMVMFALLIFLMMKLKALAKRGKKALTKEATGQGDKDPDDDEPDGDSPDKKAIEGKEGEKKLPSGKKPGAPTAPGGKKGSSIGKPKGSGMSKPKGGGKLGGIAKVAGKG